MLDVYALAQRGIRVTRAELPANAVFRRTGTEVHVNAAAERPTQLFQLLHLVALERQADLLDATLDLARFRSQTARDVARVGLANYFAGAALMPYRAFLAAAQSERHDLERLAHLFDASLEQVAHRLSTLQRPGAKGVPFFLIRVDNAGNVSKRFSAGSLNGAGSYVTGQGERYDRYSERQRGRTFGLRRHQGEHRHQHLHEAGGQQTQEAVAGDRQVDHCHGSVIIQVPVREVAEQGKAQDGQRYQAGQRSPQVTDDQPDLRFSSVCAEQGQPDHDCKHQQG